MYHPDFDYTMVGIRGALLIQAQGSYLTYSGQDEMGTYYHAAAPLFDSIDGLSPGGKDYKAIGESRHPRDVEEVSSRLLNA